METQIENRNASGKGVHYDSSHMLRIKNIACNRCRWVIRIILSNVLVQVIKIRIEIINISPLAKKGACAMKVDGLIQIFQFGSNILAHTLGLEETSLQYGCATTNKIEINYDTYPKHVSFDTNPKRRRVTIGILNPLSLLVNSARSQSRLVKNILWTLVNYALYQ